MKILKQFDIEQAATSAKQPVRKAEFDAAIANIGIENTNMVDYMIENKKINITSPFILDNTGIANIWPNAVHTESINSLFSSDIRSKPYTKLSFNITGSIDVLKMDINNIVYFMIKKSSTTLLYSDSFLNLESIDLLKQANTYYICYNTSIGYNTTIKDATAIEFQLKDGSRNTVSIEFNYLYINITMEGKNIP